MESNYVSILNMDSEFLHITSAEYISGYLLKLTFSNGDVRMFDFSRIYNKGIQQDNRTFEIHRASR